MPSEHQRENPPRDSEDGDLDDLTPEEDARFAAIMAALYASGVLERIMIEKID